jgi:hypothetical protein
LNRDLDGFCKNALAVLGGDSLPDLNVALTRACHSAIDLPQEKVAALIERIPDGKPNTMTSLLKVATKARVEHEEGRSHYESLCAERDKLKQEFDVWCRS